MGVQVETRYKLMVGDLFVKSVSRKGVELTTRQSEGVSAVNDFEYSGKDNDYYSHERQLADSINELNEHGIYNIKIIEYKTVTENLEREVGLIMIGETLMLRPAFADDAVGHLLEEDDSDE